MYKFEVGDKVFKPKGYKFPGTIVSIFKTTSGETRIVAEMEDNGMLHIFNENQLEKIVNGIREAGDDITYQNYVKTVTENIVVENEEYPGDCEYRFVNGTVLEDIGGKYDLYAIPFTKEQFMDRMTTDEEFAKRWGTK